jgi:RNA polymerase sigma-70 factor (ECF subfamily)
METFETYRGYLFAIAYRMLGSAMDAEDMVQETYLRYQTHQPQQVDSLKAYLTTILTRLCMDQLQLARRTREIYVGPWLPEPLHTTDEADPAPSAVSDDPERRVDMQESISLAFLTLLEELQPFERAVFLLREVFGYEFAEIAAILEKSEAACRRSFSRAKLHLQAHRPRFPASSETQQRLLTGFYRAVMDGDMAALTGMLANDVALWADAGGKVKGAASRPVFGRDHVARFILGTRRFLPENADETTLAELGEVNGQTALIFRVGDQPFFVMTVDMDDSGRVQTIRIVANPDKLARV